ncbi:unnamed protein product [Linum trigynum]|uniref:Uncharacterized protein n=1 Tax=Linum trigynum TaxID=586398 RepID=A0AAV2DS71_9ROSI
MRNGEGRGEDVTSVAAAVDEGGGRGGRRERNGSDKGWREAIGLRRGERDGVAVVGGRGRDGCGRRERWRGMMRQGFWGEGREDVCEGESFF